MTPKEKARELRKEFGEKALKVVDMLINEHEGDTDSRRAYKRCGFLLEVEHELEELERNKSE